MMSVAESWEGLQMPLEIVLPSGLISTTIYPATATRRSTNMLSTRVGKEEA